MTTSISTAASARGAAHRGVNAPAGPPRGPLGARVWRWALGGAVTAALVAAGWWITTPRLAASATQLDFGEQRLVPDGVTAPAATRQKLTLRNDGWRTARVQPPVLRGTNAADFELRSGCDQASLAPGEHCDFELHYQPRQRGTSIAELAFATRHRLPPVRLAGRALAGVIAAPGQLDFGAAEVGSGVVVRRLQLQNEGDAPVALEPLEGVHAPWSVQLDACSGRALAPQARCAIDLAFAPTGAGAYEITLRLPSDALDRRKHDVLLSGSGRNAGDDPTRPDLQFGPVAAGTVSAQRRVLLRNGSDEPVRFSHPTLSPAHAPFEIDSSICTAQPVPSGGSCAVLGRFLADAGARGPRSARLQFDSSAPGARPVMVDLYASVAAPVLKLAPAALDLGTIEWQPGATSRQLEITLVNEGDAPMVVQGVQVRGRAAAHFRVAPNCTAPVAPGERCRVRVLYAPTEPGTSTAELVIDAPHTEGTLRAPLRAAALPK